MILSPSGTATDRHPAGKKKKSSAYASNKAYPDKIRLGLVMLFCYMLCASPHLPRDPFAVGSSRPVSSLDSSAALLVQQSGGQVVLDFCDCRCFCIATVSY